MSEERFYGRVPQLPDQRDNVYAVPPPVMAEMPPAVDLSLPLLPAPFEPANDQGRLGSCGPNAESEDIAFDLLKQGVVNPPKPSRLFLYWCTRSLMGTTSRDSGVDNRTMLKALAQFGWCDESLWPYDVSKFAVRPPQECFDQAATRKAIQYLAVPQSLAQMKGCLASGDPFIYGFTVYESFESPAVAQTGIVPMPGMPERVLGGHDILCVGYDDSTQRFKMKNSWGAGWGVRGYCWMPYSYCTNPNLASDFWTVQHAPFGPPPPPPPGESSLVLYPEARQVRLPTGWTVRT